MRLTALLALVLALPATAPAEPTPAPDDAAKKAIASHMRAHVRFLSDDLLEGRGPASRGDALAEKYIAAQLEAAGLEPGAPDGTFFQPFDIVGVDAKAPEQVTLARGTQSVSLRYRDDYIAVSGVQSPEARVQDAEVVFVGYGIVAPEYRWNDFKAADLKGKVLLIMNNDPEDDPDVFAGKMRLYYGRWNYKYEQAARMGAAAALVIHTTPSAGYPWQVVQTSWSGEQFQLPATNEPHLQVEGWVTEDAARKLVTLGGQDLDTLRAAAQKRDFRPVPLGIRTSLVLGNTVTRKKTANVIGRLPGSDPQLAKEAVVYTAHHDHLGIKADAKPGEDVIYNGAYDNGTGVAALLTMAEAMSASRPRPRRSVLFAAVAAEEQGLLGSEFLVAHPPWPLGRVAANINMDGINVMGPTRDIEMIGLGKSTLDEVVRDIAAAQGRALVPDQLPDRGFFYRSDQFNFAKAGVPAAYFPSRHRRHRQARGLGQAVDGALRGHRLPPALGRDEGGLGLDGRGAGCAPLPRAGIARGQRPGHADLASGRRVRGGAPEGPGRGRTEMTGRPRDDEYVPSFSGYVSLVPETEVLPVLESQRAEVRAFAAAIPAERERHAYAAGKWTIRDVFGHLGDGERVFGYRAFCIGRGDTVALPGFDENAYVTRSGFAECPLSDLVDELLHLRDANLATFRRLDAAGWARVGTANNSPVSVRALAFIMAGHVRHHLRILSERYGA
jgi:Zn-dependent M28 family amino/carboxypeptidase